MSSSKNLQDFRIPLEELTRATDNVDSSRIKHGGYRGELSQRWQNRTAFIKRYNKEEYKSHELEIVSMLDNEHIISFIGYCDEDENYIYTAYEYFNHERLAACIVQSDTGDSFGWPDRLKICIMVAKVLNYLHSGVGELGRIIHEDVKCENILRGLDDYAKLIIKVSGFKHSHGSDLHQHHSCPEDLFKKSHTDPIYKETNLLNAESDVYSFGVLMFEVLHGIPDDESDEDRDENLRKLMNLVQCCYDEGPYKLVDPFLRRDFSHRSLHIFATRDFRMDEIIKTIEKAWDVQNNEGSASETVQRFVEKFRIPTEEIMKAIGAEDYDRIISSRTPHMTYRGKLVDRCNDREAFFEHWTSKQSHEGTNDRTSMPRLISNFHHENITPAIGVYGGDGDLIIAWEYALNGSLYSKLETQSENSYLTWAERLKICLGDSNTLMLVLGSTK